jgi:hypothetical protein
VIDSCAPKELTEAGGVKLTLSGAFAAGVAYNYRFTGSSSSSNTYSSDVQIMPTVDGAALATASTLHCIAPPLRPKGLQLLHINNTDWTAASLQLHVESDRFVHILTEAVLCYRGSERRVTCQRPWHWRHSDHCTRRGLHQLY